MYTAITRQQRRSTRRSKWPFILLLCILLFGGYSVWALLKPLPLLQPETATSQLFTPVNTSSLSWPSVGQSAVGLLGSDILETHGPQTPVPTASTAKLITTLTVLQQKPLQLDASGPVITLSASDVALYNSYAAQQGSVVKVVAGEQITEYQMLQTILLPSADNMADSLAIWAYGSLNAYYQAANAYLLQHGLSSTHVGTDASGLLPTTTSTAHDLVKLGELAMQDPVLAQIVNQPTATDIPVVKNIKNVNFLLGTANIVGIKTGNTDQAGGVFVSASRTTVNGKSVTLVTAFANAPTLFMAVNGSLPFIQSAQANFKPVTIVKANTTVGHYALPWGGTVSVVASKDLSLSTWNDSVVKATVHIVRIPASTTVNQIAGQLTTGSLAFADQQSVPLTLVSNPAPATVWWRLIHP